MKKNGTELNPVQGRERMDMKGQKGSVTDRIINIWVVLFGLFFVALYVYRAAVSGITYDEAFTYLVYSHPLSGNFSLSEIKRIYYESLANNHWINTLLIAMVDRIFQAEYSEFLIRLPSVLFGCAYVIVLSILYLIRRIRGAAYTLLICSYYLNEFLGLARGYGQAAVLVFFALILYEAWRRKPDQTLYLTFSLGFLVSSAYANSVALTVCFSLGIVILLRLIREKRLWAYGKKSWPFLLIYVAAGLMILKYHFKVSAPGLPLYYAENTSLWGTVKSYVGMFLPGNKVVSAVSLLLMGAFLWGILSLLFKRTLWDHDPGLALLIYMICILLMDTVFGRGGFQGRTLLPAYPLFVFGVIDILAPLYDRIKEKLPEVLRSILRYIAAALAVFVFLGFFLRTDPVRTSDWYEDYDIKILYETDPLSLPAYDHASIAFYKAKGA